MPALANPRHERFAREYVYDANQTQAAIRTGYASKSANVNAVRLIANESISKRISELKTAQFKKLQMGADEVLSGLANVARFDARKLFNEDGSFKGVTAIDDQTALSIAGIEIEEKILCGVGENGEEQTQVLKSRTTKIKANDRVKALGLLAKHLKLVDTQNADALPLQVEVLMAVARMNREQLQQILDGKLSLGRTQAVRIPAVIEQKPG